MGHFCRQSQSTPRPTRNDGGTGGVLLQTESVSPPRPTRIGNEAGGGVFAGNIRKLSSVAPNDDKAYRMFQWEQALRQADDVDTMMAAQAGRFR